LYEDSEYENMYEMISNPMLQVEEFVDSEEMLNKVRKFNKAMV